MKKVNAMGLGIGLIPIPTFDLLLRLAGVFDFTLFGIIAMPALIFCGLSLVAYGFIWGTTEPDPWQQVREELEKMKKNHQ